MLEDEFVDVYAKAKRGVRRSDAELAEATGISEALLRSWAAGTAVPGDAEAQALAVALELDPRKLADAAAVRFDPAVGLPSFITTRVQQPHPSNGYVCFSGTEAAIVDPAGDPAALRAAVEAVGRPVRYVLVTHEHADHCDAAAAIASAYPAARFVMHPADATALGRLAAKTIAGTDGATLPFGTETVTVRHTPGHTDGSLCFLVGNVVFTGDSLFAGSVGNVFARTATYADLRRSVRERVLTLDPATLVLPGHGPASTIALERAHNPFF